MVRISTTALLAALLAVTGCDEGSGGTDAATDTTQDTAVDLCSSHPNTCNLDDRNPLAPWDCCPAAQTCCPLCHDADRCQFNYQCLDSCPETLPCTGVLGSGAFSCHYDPDDFTTTVYCPVPEGTPPSTVVACTDSCETGVVCPFDGATFGDAALCCPAGTACSTGGFDLPFCE